MSESDELISDVLAATSHYDVLGLEENVTYAEIRSAYRRRVLKCHPDKCRNNPSASEAFTKIHKAFAVLGNETRRAKYDAQTTHDDYTAATLTEEEEQRHIRDLLIRLSTLIDVPEDALLDDFCHFVHCLAKDDVLGEILASATVKGCFAGIVAAVALPITPLAAAVLLALGPAALGPAVAWETVLAQFEGVSLQNRVVARPVRTVGSVGRTTVHLTVMWSAVCAALSARLVVCGTKYAYNLASVMLAKNASREDLDEWFVVTMEREKEQEKVLVSSLYDVPNLELYPQDVDGAEWIMVNA
mmetsp:Transcript_7637/g.9424  ORF Transcript_7637/g.9424 Transcript_7637/m.9424 type:complete len:301 (+) Transcript_7637:138-1040(+)|eukprot:CAMPEP_0172499246 /NCGR_PEP_ID=MMETSP1066-20121228/124339_1 /TAXON_ID=671091 /ORGANISM="Coscinodiscus wailesii, Strain CCMP2513" /LENGTH=300 /DNA_ID=CAMNT_0013272871 /DNA_START=137 /DNA_END=1039 /DNA_ORIENTATION=+